MFPECRAALDAVFLCRIGQRRVVVFGEYLNVFVVILFENVGINLVL